MQTIPLSKDWLFRGEQSGGFTPIAVPGSWKDLPEFRDYNGIGHYENNFTVLPETSQKRAFLHFGSVFRRARVSLNGALVGEHNGFQSPFTFEITRLLQKGANRLSVDVGADRPEGDLFGISSIQELVPLHFHGITQPVTLMLTDSVFVKDLYAPIDLQAGKARLLVTVNSDLPQPANAEVCIRLSLPEDETPVTVCKHTSVAPGESELCCELDLADLKLWSPEHPVLYDAAVTLNTAETRDEFRTQVGFKHFEVRGKDFYLNGEPIYLLGYGDDMVYPAGCPSATDSGFYVHGLQRAKDYGFNFVRFHSHFPFEAAMDACDRMGMLLQPELALANIGRESFTPENQQIFIDQWRELIAAYRHHPCIAAWCGGNEMEWGFPFNRTLYQIAKTMDPYRPVQTTDGNFSACDVNETQDYAGIVPAEYTDYLPYGELNGMFDRDDCGKPQVVHEMGNYATVFNIHDLPRWQSCPVKNKRIEQLNDLVIEKDCQTLYETALQASFALQKTCHKLNIEKARLAPAFKGYHLWTLTDYYETTQGLLNSFYEDKAFTAKEFARLNAPTVLLWDTSTFTFAAEQTAELRFFVSKYGVPGHLSGRLTVRLGNQTLFSEDVSVEGHGLLPLVTLQVTVPSCSREEALPLSIALDCESRVYANSWTLYAVPRPTFSREKEIYIHYLSRHLFEGDNIPIRHFTIPQPIGEDQLIVTDFLYGGMTDAVAAGASMLLFTRPDTFAHTVRRNSFKTPWWDPGEIWYLNHTNNRQYTGFVEKHPATAMLPYTGAWQLDLFDGVEQADAVDLDAAGLDVEPLIYGIDTNLHRLGYLFQFGYGKGKILVCSFNHSRKDLQSISVDYLLRSLVNYAMSTDFCPRKSISPEQLSAIFR